MQSRFKLHGGQMLFLQLNPLSFCSCSNGDIVANNGRTISISSPQLQILTVSEWSQQSVGIAQDCSCFRIHVARRGMKATKLSAWISPKMVPIYPNLPFWFWYEKPLDLWGPLLDLLGQSHIILRPRSNFSQPCSPCQTCAIPPSTRGLAIRHRSDC